MARACRAQRGAAPCAAALCGAALRCESARGAPHCRARIAVKRSAQRSNERARSLHTAAAAAAAAARSERRVQQLEQRFADDEAERLARRGAAAHPPRVTIVLARARVVTRHVLLFLRTVFSARRAVAVAVGNRVVHRDQCAERQAGARTRPAPSAPRRRGG